MISEAESDLIEKIEAELRRRGEIDREGPLWPAEYCEDTFESAWAFIGKCRTWNEAKKRWQHFPDKPYLRRIVKRWLHCKKYGGVLYIEKCRRMVVSWLLRALELREMGIQKVNLMLGGETFGAAARHVWRLDAIYTDLRKRYLKGELPGSWSLPESRSINHEGDTSLRLLTLDTGASCLAVNGQAGNLQGEGVACITLEEASQYEQLIEILAQARIITKPEAGEIGGMIVLVTNASANVPWQEIKKGLVEEGKTGFDLEKVLPGFGERDLGRGSAYLHIQYFADPDKGPAWIAEMKDEMRLTPRQFLREILMDDTIHDGDPVWQEYNTHIHEFHGEPKAMITGKDGSILEGMFLGGWDCGSSRQPAFVLAFLTKKTQQLRFVLEIVPETQMAMETFAPIVHQTLKAFIPGHWAKVLHVGDETVRNKGGNINKSSQDIAREKGINIHPISNNIAQRDQATTAMMVDWCDETGGKPRVIYSVKGCPVLVAGNRGAYCMRTRKGTATRGPKLQLLEPEKNFFSHVNDGHQYVNVRVFRMIGKMMGLQRARPGETKKLPTQAEVEWESEDTHVNEKARRPRRTREPRVKAVNW